MTKIAHIFLALLLVSTQNGYAFSETNFKQEAGYYLLNQGKNEYASALSLRLEGPRLSAPLSLTLGRTQHSSRTKINQDSLFQIGSITKSFITAILLQLADDPNRHFSLDDPIDKYFPKYRNWHAITVRMLMNMTSGIPDYFSDPALLNMYATHPYLQYQPKAWVSVLAEKPLLFTPGTAFHYSNTNYFLLGMLVERLTDSSLQEEINTRLIKPFHLTHTYFIKHQVPSTLRPYLVHGYQFETGFAPLIPRGTDITYYSLSYMDAAGGLISTPNDMAKWVHALFTPGKVLSKKGYQALTTLISTKTGRSIKAVSADDPKAYGLGVYVRYSPRLKQAYFMYEGMTLGYRALYLYAPKAKLLIAMTINSSSDDKQNHLLEFANQLSVKLLPPPHSMIAVKKNAGYA